MLDSIGEVKAGVQLMGDLKEILFKTHLSTVTISVFEGYDITIEVTIGILIRNVTITATITIKTNQNDT